MQTDAKQIHPDVADRDHHQTHHGNKGRTAPLPATAETGVQISRIHQPADQCPGLFRIPAPVAAPGFVGPHSSADDANSEHQEANGDGAVTETVQLLRGAQLNGLQLQHAPFCGSDRLAKTTAADRAAAQFQSFPPIRHQHGE